MPGGEMRSRQFSACFVLSLMLFGCAPPEPLKIGYLGGLSGRVADLGEAGRSGALLAVEEINGLGGINGRKVELIVQDDAQQQESALNAVDALVAAGVSAIIGPMTSSVAETILPTIERAGIVTVSPTVTSTSLSGKDDLFFKVAPPISENTRISSRHLFDRGARRLAIAYDLSNRAFSADWVAQYRRDFAGLGGQVVAEATFTSGDEQGYGHAVQQLIDARPDAFLFISNAVDTVRLIQIVRNRGLNLPVTTSPWAATEHFIELGGRTVEGVTLTQFFDRSDSSPGYRKFADTFRARFKQEPGFASVAAYDATRATLGGLTQSSGQGGAALKAVLLSGTTFDGLQQKWQFDRYGDAQRATYMTVVNNGRLSIVK
ncbi:ABC transporter substrate-binding protein [Dechloromonas sp. TW-R-39-2]|nr:ABC transporter substrate-binding protein [Dechloromonas sp. TW-R-39-2]